MKEKDTKSSIVLDTFDEIEDFIIKIEKTLQHNLDLGYIREETTVVELLEFFKGMKDNYLPFQREISRFIDQSQNKWLILKGYYKNGCDYMLSVEVVIYG